MHVAVLGAGALGSVYGVRLAARGDVAVDFVVRAARAGAGAIRIERVEGGEPGAGEPEGIDAPSRVTEVPGHADVVLACVRADQLVDATAVLKAGPEVPIVVLTPMLPATLAAMRGALGTRVVAAMPGIAAYVNDAGIARYWVPGVAATLIDESGDVGEARGHGTREALVDALKSAGLEARVELGVHEASPATAITFLPLAMALDAAGSAIALVEDGELVEEMVKAAEEARAIAEQVGKAAAWATMLTRFVGKRTLGMGVGLARMRSTEAVAFVEGHFGRRARAQNVAMGREVAAIAEQMSTPHAAIDALLARLAPAAAW